MTLSSDLYIGHVEYDPPDSLDGEYVEIENLGEGSQDMTGWTLRDDQSNAYPFPADFILPGDATVNVWTKDGTDTATDLYWRLGDPIWGNETDTAYLQDDTGAVIDLLDW